MIKLLAISTAGGGAPLKTPYTQCFFGVKFKQYTYEFNDKIQVTICIPKRNYIYIQSLA